QRQRPSFLRRDGGGDGADGVGGGAAQRHVDLVGGAADGGSHDCRALFHAGAVAKPARPRCQQHQATLLTRRGASSSRRIAPGSTRRNPAARRCSTSATNGSQNAAASSSAIGFPWSSSWRQVMISTSSSSVPNPPGSATKASASSAISAFRSCI